MLRTRQFANLLLCGVLCLTSMAAAQTETATVSGRVSDSSGAVVPGAAVELQSVERGIVTATATNGAGIYVFPSVQPGQYRIAVRKDGFRQVNVLDLVVNVQDHIEQNFRLQVGSISESITVSGGAPLVNTESAAVSTVVDHTYVENMPLNGRSFQDLILLAPGVLTTSPQLGFTSGGEFSVNGQRTESNYYTVDGVSANTGISAFGPGPGSSGSLGVSTAVGTTQALVSVDALEEFRIQTSSYSAEYGRNPGGQFFFATRSGTNQWHGTAFEYLRNDFFDANNWFNDFFRQPEPALRQHDFGGTLGGPVDIPGLYNGKDKSFFLFSYEGLRAIEPQAATINFVPDSLLRQSAPAALRTALNAFPVANSQDLGNGLAEFIATWSNPSSINAYSVRFDHAFRDKLRLFFRLSATPSIQHTRGSGDGSTPSIATSLRYESRTYTFGATTSPWSRLSNDFRLNYSANTTQQQSQLDSCAGAQAVDLLQLHGISPHPSSFLVGVNLALSNVNLGILQQRSSARQSQWNVVDTSAVSLGHHLLKFGVDFRKLGPDNEGVNPNLRYFFFTTNAVQSNNPNEIVIAPRASARPLFVNFSAFLQDEWKATPRLNLSAGLRWEVNPAPGAASGNLPYTVQGNSLSSLVLAPRGTPLWRTGWYNFAPRIGAAYVLRGMPGRETVVRAGGGVFFDTGQQVGTQPYSGPGFSAFKLAGSIFGKPTTFPMPPVDALPPIVNPPKPPYGAVVAFPPHFHLPYTLQWNVAAEQSMGKSQALTISYLGAHSARLVEQQSQNISSLNPNFSFLITLGSGRTADYDAMQLQYQRRLTRGLTSLASYTWSHNIDYGSQNLSLPFRRGNSDYDARHNFTGALSYDVPMSFKSGLARVALQHWGFDDRFTARTSFPVTLNGDFAIDPATGRTSFTGLDLVPGAPLYLHGSQYPGGQAINPNAFTVPTNGSQGGTAPRNFVRGFGAWQMNCAIRREFPIYEGLRLQFRAEAFNIFNHPNFGFITPDLGTPTFGQATATLNASLGGLSPLYQSGGPRSMQFALKLTF